MTCIALDDEPLALRILEHYIEQIDELEPQGFFTNPEIARACLQTKEIDLLFLDVNMPDVTGIDFFKNLKQPPLVIFSTAFRDFAVEGFELNAVDYLVKPYEFSRFQIAVQRALEQFNSQQNKIKNTTFINVNSEHRIVQIDLNDLYLVETLDDYLCLHLLSKSRPVLTLMTLKSFAELLPADQFMRVHRSYLVNLQQVESRRYKKLLVQGREVPIGFTYLEKVKKIF